MPNSPLYTAVTSDDPELLKLHIKIGTDPLNTLFLNAASKGRMRIVKWLSNEIGHTRSPGGKSPLHVAAAANHLQIVKYFIEDCKLDPLALDEQNQTPLSCACEKGHLDVARYLVKLMSGKHMTMNDNYDLPDRANGPLCCACSEGNLPIVKYLVEECGCDPSRSDGTRTPLYSAVMGNQIHIVKYLLLKKVQVIKSESLVILAVRNRNLDMVKLVAQKYSPSCKYEDDIPPLQFAAYLGELAIFKHLLSLRHNPRIGSAIGTLPLHTAAREGHLNVVKYLVDNELCNPASQEEDGTTPLYSAASHGHVSICRYLTLEYHCDPLHVSIFSNNSLHGAIHSGRIDVAQYFLKELKCDLNSKGEHGYTPILFAAASGNLEMVKFLVDELHCDLKQSSDMQRTALHVASTSGHLPVLKYLIENKKCDLNVTDIDNATILFCSAASGQLHILKYLIEELKMDANSSNPKTGKTPLTAAATHGHLPIVSYLLDIGCDPLDHQSSTPLHCAAGCGHLDIVKYLMTSYREMYSMNPFILPLEGATTKGQLAIVKYFLEDMHCSKDVADPYGNTLVHIAAISRRLKVVDYLVRDMKCNLWAQNDRQNSPMHCVCEEGYLEVLQFFINELNCDPNAPGYQRNKAIHCAAREGHLNIVKYLVEDLNCDVDSRNQANWTPLHSARNYLDVVRYLVKKKARVLSLSNEGNTPLHVAASLDHLNVVMFLTKLDHSPLYMTNHYDETPLKMALLNCKDNNFISISALYLIVTMFFLL